jgi:3-deoxy-manno-octulosonate cytidylyltransferase (CMP-KDO synthetase)
MASVRFPGKPLALAGGVPMVIQVYRQAKKALEHVIIATSDPEIGQAAEDYGAEWVLTGSHHPNGTSRCQEAAQTYISAKKQSFEAIINIQGDEPSVRPDMILALAAEIMMKTSQIATLVSQETDPLGLTNPNRVKVVTDLNDNALYFSRSPIPFLRDPLVAELVWLAHIGLYAFRTEILNQVVTLEPTPLEVKESLEQLRWLENGLKIRCCQTHYQGFGIDTPSDLEKFNRIFSVQG